MQTVSNMDFNVDYDLTQHGYTPEQLRSFDRHLELNFGPVDQIMAAPSCSNPVIDLIVLAPDPLAGRNFYTLLTRGMGSYIAPARNDMERSLPERVELIMFIETAWEAPRISADTGPDTFWPALSMLRLARMPYATGRRIGPDTIFDNEEPLCENSPYEGLLVRSVATSCIPEARIWTMPDLQQVIFLQVVPLMRDEMDHARNDDITSLYDYLGWRGHFTVNFRSSAFDPTRSYFDYVFCDSRWYLRFIERNRLEVSDSTAWLPGAWYMRFLIDSGMVNEDFVKEFHELKGYIDGEECDFDFEAFYRDVLQGCLDRRFLNKHGWFFTEHYFDSSDYPNYHSDLLDLRARHLGVSVREGLSFTIPEGTESSVIEAMWQDIRQVMKKRLHFMAHEMYFDRDYDRLLSQCTAAMMDCKSSFYPPVIDISPMVCHLRHAMRTVLAGEGCPVLVEVSADMLKRLACSQISGVVMARRDWGSLESLINSSWRSRAPGRTEDELIVGSVFQAWADRSYNRYQAWPPLQNNGQARILTLLKKAAFNSKVAERSFEQLCALYLKSAGKSAHERPVTSVPGAHRTASPDALAQPGATAENAPAMQPGSAPGTVPATGSVPAPGSSPASATAAAPAGKARGGGSQERQYRKSVQKILQAMCCQPEDDTFMDMHTIWHDSQRVSRPLLLCHLPVKHPVDVISWLPYLSGVPGLSIHNMMEIFHMWFDELGAMPLVLRDWSIEFVTAEPLKPRQAQRLVHELVALCPKLRLLLEMKVCTLESLQDKIRGKHSFTVDWYPVEACASHPWGY